jgi:hypothetical protein
LNGNRKVQRPATGILALNAPDGKHDLLDIAERPGLRYESIVRPMGFSEDARVAPIVQGKPVQLRQVKLEIDDD